MLKAVRALNEILKGCEGPTEKFEAFSKFTQLTATQQTQLHCVDVTFTLLLKCNVHVRTFVRHTRTGREYIMIVQTVHNVTNTY